MKIATIFMIIILSNHLDGHSCPSASNSWSLMKELYSVMITTWIWILICFWFLSWSKFSTAETELFISNQARSKVDIVTIINWLRILDLVQSKEWLCNAEQYQVSKNFLDYEYQRQNTCSKPYIFVHMIISIRTEHRFLEVPSFGERLYCGQLPPWPPFGWSWSASSIVVVLKREMDFMDASISFTTLAFVMLISITEKELTHSKVQTNSKYFQHFQIWI